MALGQIQGLMPVTAIQRWPTLRAAEGLIQRCPEGVGQYAGIFMTRILLSSAPQILSAPGGSFIHFRGVRPIFDLYWPCKRPQQPGNHQWHFSS